MYKAVVMYGNLKSPFMCNTIRGGGWYKSNIKTISPVNYSVCKGIHVLLPAHKNKYYWCANIRCWAYVKDLIAVGSDGDMVFTKIFIPANGVKRVMKKLKQKLLRYKETHGKN